MTSAARHLRVIHEGQSERVPLAGARPRLEEGRPLLLELDEYHEALNDDLSRILLGEALEEA